MSFSEHIPHQPSVVSPSPEVIALREKSREAILRELLPYDYDYAQQSGLVDMFYYDGAYDGLIHTLAGSSNLGEAAAPDAPPAAAGFHHEPSASVVWPTELMQDGRPQPVTRVDRSHLSALEGKKRRAFREYPMEPFAARVVVGGLVKYATHRDSVTGEDILKPAKNSMFPNEYDALAVMQAIRIARATRDSDSDSDEHKTTEDGTRIIRAVGSVPLIDGTTPMNVGLIMEEGTERVITAYPILPTTPGVMKLEPDAVRRHLFGE